MNTIKISFELVNGYVGGWHEIFDRYPVMFPNIADLSDSEKLKHFNDNYLDYTLKDGELFYDESNKGFEKNVQERKKQIQISLLKQQIHAISEDIEQEALGFIRSDYSEKKEQKAALINQIRVLEGKQLRKINKSKN